MMEKVDLKRAKFSGILDVLGFLAALVMTAGYIVIDLVKATGLRGPDKRLGKDRKRSGKSV